MRKSNTRIWLWVVSLAALAVIFILLRRARLNQTAEEVLQTGEVVTAFIGDLSASASASGQIAAQRSADIALTTAGRVARVAVTVGDSVQAGDILVELETDTLRRQVESAQQALIIQQANLEELLHGATAMDVAAAQAAVASAEANLNQLLAGPDPAEIAAAEAQVRAANANLWAASERRDQAAAGPTQAELLQAQADLDAARVVEQSFVLAYQEVLECCLGPTEEQVRFSLEAARMNVQAAEQALAEVQAGADPDEVGAADASVNAARANLDAAQANLDLLQQGPTEAEVAAARTQLAQAQANLDRLLNGVSEAEVAIVTAQVEQARIALQRAEHNLTRATLLAPFDGVVTAIYVAEGELASGRAVTLIDSNSLEVVLSVDEVDLAFIEAGQPAQVTLEPFPNEEIASQVVAIAPKSNASADSGPVTYNVHLSLTQTDLPLRVGMSASGRLITAARSDVLLVPNRAILADRQTGRYYVNLLTGADLATGTLSQVEVTIGLRDSQYTEITSGLAAGDRLVIGDFSALEEATPAGPFQGLGGFRRGGN